MDTNVSVSNSIGKDMKEMSFVGLHATKSGIIAFADSKASLSYGAGFIEDKKRGQIQKIFYNEKFIFVYHGNNELFKEHIKIEDYIFRHLSSKVATKEKMSDKQHELPQRIAVTLHKMAISYPEI